MTMSLPVALSMFMLGVFHGLEPGHGKMIVASYLVGRRGRWPDAVYLGGVVALSHSAVIIVLAALSTLVAERLRTEAVVSSFELGSGVVVCLVGLLMLKNRLTRHSDCCAHEPLPPRVRRGRPGHARALPIAVGSHGARHYGGDRPVPDRDRRHARAPHSCIAYAARSWNHPAMFSTVTLCKAEPNAA